MRAPVEGPGSWALESAMDELALELGIDPLDLRLANYAETEPMEGSRGRRRSCASATPRRPSSMAGARGTSGRARTATS